VRKLKWWLWVVGAWYFILALVGAVYVLFTPDAYMKLYAGMLPSTYAGDELAVLARIDGDFALMFVWFVLGTMMFAATRDIARARFFIWAMVWMEFGYVMVNVIWTLRGFPSVVTYIIVHLIFGVTGIVFLRQTKAES
jgi:hypothetical protein